MLQDCATGPSDMHECDSRTLLFLSDIPYTLNQRTYHTHSLQFIINKVRQCAMQALLIKHIAACNIDEVQAGNNQIAPYLHC